MTFLFSLWHWISVSVFNASYCCAYFCFPQKNSLNSGRLLEKGNKTKIKMSLINISNQIFSFAITKKKGIYSLKRYFISLLFLLAFFLTIFFFFSLRNKIRRNEYWFEDDKIEKKNIIIVLYFLEQKRVKILKGKRTNTKHTHFIIPLRHHFFFLNLWYPVAFTSTSLNNIFLSVYNRKPKKALWMRFISTASK